MILHDSTDRARSKTVDVDSDHYFNDDDGVKDLENYGVKVQPVDLNGAFVSVKGEANILEKTQENIRKRFSLGGES